MSEQQSQRDDDDAPPSVPLANAWAMTTVLGFMTVAVISAFFIAQSNLYERMGEAQAVISRQNHCIAVRRACHNQELTPQLCDLRQRARLDARDFGPTIEGEFQGASCPGTPAAQEELCALVQATVPTEDCDKPAEGAPPASTPPT